MRPEFPKNKLINGVKLEKSSEIPRLDKSYMNNKYQQIQESNERLQRLISKFSNDPERKLRSVHESVICKLNPSTKNDTNQVKKKDFNFKINSTKIGLDVIFETPKLEKLNANRNNKTKKIENFNQNKSQIKGKIVQSKNFISLNKKDAFDPHCLAGRNSNIVYQNESEKEKDVLN